MKWYYLAALTWVLEILMFISIIFIPAVLYLREVSCWFDTPFAEAWVKAIPKKWNLEE